MKNTTNTPLKSKTLRGISMKKLLFLFAAVLLLSFAGDSGRAVYEVPRLLQSIASADLDLDGDIDIVTGHMKSNTNNWGGIHILENTGTGFFQKSDSVYLNSWQMSITINNLGNDQKPSIVARHFDNGQQFMVVINQTDSGYTTNLFPMQYGITAHAMGNMNSDSYPDIVVFSADNELWGILFNDGNGEFLEPIYYEIDFSPSTISCGDFDNNGLDDVVLTGVYAEVYFNYGDHFEKLELENGTGRTNTHIVDFDGDNDLDIVAYTCFWGYSFVSVQENIDGQSFELREVLNFEELTNEFAASDFNNDGLPDAAFHLMDNSGLIVYFNQGDFVLDKPLVIDIGAVEGAGCIMSCSDFDNNGFSDIAFSQNYNDFSTVNILFNDGLGGFSEEPITTIPETNSSKSSPYQLTCFPNPVKTHSTFSFNQSDYSKSSIHLTDLRGNLVVALEPIQDGDGNVVLDISQHRLKHGLYIASLFVDNQMVESIKIVVE